MEMKRIAALILVGLFLFAGLNVKSAVAEDVQYAEISSVQLGLRDKAVLGPYSFTFADFDPDNDAAKILISGGSESSGVWIEDGQTVYYPSNDEKHIFALSVNFFAVVEIIANRFDDTIFNQHIGFDHAVFSNHFAVFDDHYFSCFLYAVSRSGSSVLKTPSFL